MVLVGEACQSVPLLADRGASIARTFLLGGERPSPIREREVAATLYQHEQILTLRISINPTVWLLIGSYRYKLMESKPLTSQFISRMIKTIV